MKQVIVFLLCCSAFYSHANTTDNPFVGTWQLISGEYVDEKGKLITYQSIGITSQKVIANKHFSFVSLSDGKFWAAGTGTYQFTNDEYAEQPNMASFELIEGGKYVFQYEIKGDQWHNSRWKDGKRVEYEVWQRLD